MSEIQSPKKLRDYEILRVLGKGSQGIVYLCKSKNKEIAVKQVSCKNLDEANAALNEGLHSKNMKHENLVDCFDVCLDMQTDFTVCTFLEYYPEGDLAQYLSKHEEKIPEDLVIDFGIQLASGLSHIHENSLIHRDMKPENVFLERIDDKLVLKIGDFGLVKHLDSIKTQTICGSLLYVAPEVMENRRYTASIDIFSLGAILYHIMTRKKKYMYLDILKQPDCIHEICQELQKNYQNKLSIIVSKMLACNPKDRPTAKEVKIILEQIKGGSGPDTPILSHDFSNPEEIHYLIACDACGKEPIIGIRYKCKKCYDYDLCEDCHIEKKIHEQHNFEMIIRSVHEKLPTCEIHDEIRCDGCQICPIVGLRYQCMQCFAFDYCEKCFHSLHEKHFDGTHNFIDMTRKSYYSLILNYRDLGNWKQVMITSQNLLFCDHKELPCMVFCAEALMEMKDDEINDMKANNLLKNVIDSASDDNYHSVFAKGLAYKVLQNSDKAFQCFTIAAKHNHTMAQNYLGECYFFGFGCKRNEEEAFKWFSLAGRRGDVRAQYNLGLITLMNGDQKRSFEWFKRAAMQGHAMSQYQLGKLYGMGVGGQNKRKKAEEWMKKSASQGLNQAKRELNMGSFLQIKE